LGGKAGVEGKDVREQRNGRGRTRNADPMEKGQMLKRLLGSVDGA